MLDDVGQRVRAYYDANTAAFLRYGQGRGTHTVRRAVKAPGMERREDWFRHADEQIIRRLPAPPSGQRLAILDIGCGVGGSLFYIASRLTLSALGVTISPVQAEIARAHAADIGALDHLRFEAGDFLEMTFQPEFDGAIAIESFLHVADTARWFQVARSALRPGALLFILDDFLTARPLTPGDRDVLAAFRRGWHAPGLVPLARAEQLAAQAGFALEERQDWTRWLDLGRPRDRAISAFLSVARALPAPVAGPLGSSPWFQNLEGGDALQRALTGGLIHYGFTVWRAR